MNQISAFVQSRRCRKTKTDTINISLQTIVLTFSWGSMTETSGRHILFMFTNTNRCGETQTHNTLWHNMSAPPLPRPGGVGTTCHRLSCQTPPARNRGQTFMSGGEKGKVGLKRGEKIPSSCEMEIVKCPAFGRTIAEESL